jgi:hypothetical protein
MNGGPAVKVTINRADSSPRSRPMVVHISLRQFRADMAAIAGGFKLLERSTGRVINLTEQRIAGCWLHLGAGRAGYSSPLRTAAGNRSPLPSLAAACRAAAATAISTTCSSARTARLRFTPSSLCASAGRYFRASSEVAGSAVALTRLNDRLTGSAS